MCSTSPANSSLRRGAGARTSSTSAWAIRTGPRRGTSSTIDRERAAHRHARLLGIEGHFPAAARDLQLVPHALWRRTRPGFGSDSHDRIEGRHCASGACDARRRGYRAGAQSKLSDPHLRAGDCRGRHSPRAHAYRDRFFRGAGECDPRYLSQAQDADRQFSKQSDHTVRRPAVFRAADRDCASA